MVRPTNAVARHRETTFVSNASGQTGEILIGCRSDAGPVQRSPLRARDKAWMFERCGLVRLATPMGIPATRRGIVSS